MGRPTMHTSIFGEKTALVDASHEKFRGLFMSTLKEQLAKAGRGLDYILVSHTEPDHSGTLSFTGRQCALMLSGHRSP